MASCRTCDFYNDTPNGLRGSLLYCLHLNDARRPLPCVRPYLEHYRRKRKEKPNEALQATLL